MFSILQLPPAPPPPPFPEGYAPPQTEEAEKDPETQQTAEPQPPAIDPIIDQGPAKRMKIWSRVCSLFFILVWAQSEPVKSLKFFTKANLRFMLMIF